MTMTETTTTAPKKKSARAKKRKPTVQKPKAPLEFAGITAGNCPSDCNESGCVISGKPYCGHPYKGGLQGRDLHDHAAADRVASARKILGKAKVIVEKP